MSSVSQIVKEIAQPVFGILPIGYFTREDRRSDNYVLSNGGTISAVNTGLIVDYCVKYAMGEKIDEIVYIEWAGYLEHLRVEATKYFMKDDKESLTNIYMDDQKKKICLSDFIYNVETSETFEDFVTNLYYIVQFGEYSRNINYAYNRLGTVFNTKLSKDDLNDILIYFIRSQNWIDSLGKVTPMYRFHPLGYNNTVTTGEGDFCTKTTLWDLKVSNGEPTTKDTLQLLIYYIMAKCSNNKLYRHIDSIGIYNPKINATWVCKMSTVDPAIIKNVQKLLGFGDRSIF